MKLYKIKFIKTSLIMLTSMLLCLTLNAQTPADDPGIGGPGTSDSAPAGDGAPIVPFDNNMTFLLLFSGIAFATLKVRRVTLITNL